MVQEIFMTIIFSVIFINCTCSVEQFLNFVRNYLFKVTCMFLFYGMGLFFSFFAIDSESSGGSSNPSSPTKPSPIRFPVLPCTGPKSPTGNKTGFRLSTTPPSTNHVSSMSTSSGSGMCVQKHSTKCKF